MLKLGEYKLNNILKLRNSSKNKKLFNKEISDILRGITDIIKVYNTDYTVAFFNEAGYEFYNKKPEEVIGKLCFEVLGRSARCENCPFEQIMETKEMVATERYIPELNKYMDVCCNPVFDDTGEIIFIVERLKDITEKKILELVLKDSEIKYKEIVNSFPEAIVIIQDNKVVLANNEVFKLFRIKTEDFTGNSIYRYLPPKYLKIIHRKIREIVKNNTKNMLYNIKFNCYGNNITDIQTTSSAISYNGSPAVLSVITDVTVIEKDLNKAAELQKLSLQKEFPVLDKVEVETIYVPANIVSGDFYRFYKIDHNRVVGIIIDVSGKGIVSALSLSAFDVLFLQEVAIDNEPMHIVENLNKKLANYFGENYIAVACYSLDFLNNELKVVGAGINHFIFQKKAEESKEIVMKGPFLGMFQDAIFDEVVIKFEKGDRIFFFTDGLEFIIDEDRVIQNYMDDVNITTFAKYLQEYLEDTILDVGTLQDDCTMIAFEIK
jgi:PAS domain S-box-containing protein